MAEREQGKGISSSILGGWQQVEGAPEGTFTTAKKPQDFTTDEFSKFAEASRARWDLVEYVKVKLHQLLHKQST